jgi:hypothetical protein
MHAHGAGSGSLLTQKQQGRTVMTARNRVGDVWVWGGRPFWEKIFSQVSMVVGGAGSGQLPCLPRRLGLLGVMLAVAVAVAVAVVTLHRLLPRPPYHG